MELTQDSIGKTYKDKFKHTIEIISKVRCAAGDYYVGEKHTDVEGCSNRDVLLYDLCGSVQGLYGEGLNLVEEYTPPRTQQELAEDLIAIGRGCLFLCKDTGHSQLHKGRDIECILKEANQVFNIEE